MLSSAYKSISYYLFVFRNGYGYSYAYACAYLYYNCFYYLCYYGLCCIYDWLYIYIVLFCCIVLLSVNGYILSYIIGIGYYSLYLYYILILDCSI